MRRPIAAVVLALAACAMLALAGCTGAYDSAAHMKEQTIDSSALKNGQTLQVGVDASSYPFAGESNGEMSGFNVDIASAIAQELGVKVEFVDVGSDGIEALSGDQVDMVMGIESSAAKDKCWTSDSYCPSCVTLFSLDEQATLPEKSDSLTVSAQTSSLSAYRVQKLYGDSALCAEDDLSAVFSDLTNDNAQYAAADALVGAYMANKLGISVHMVGLLQDADSYCIGISKDNETLQLAVTQALSTIQSNGVMDVIMTCWAGGSVDVSTLTVASTSSSSKDKEKKSAEAKQAISDNAGSSKGSVGANAVTIGASS